MQLLECDTKSSIAIFPYGQNMPAKNIGEYVDARCTRCGGRNMQITEEFLCSDSYEIRGGKVNATTSSDSPKASGRLFGRCRQCGHDWAFRKNPLAP